jgi:hypothetical protein
MIVRVYFYNRSSNLAGVSAIGVLSISRLDRTVQVIWASWNLRAWVCWSTYLARWMLHCFPLPFWVNLWGAMLWLWSKVSDKRFKWTRKNASANERNEEQLESQANHGYFRNQPVIYGVYTSVNCCISARVYCLNISKYHGISDDGDLSSLRLCSVVKGETWSLIWEWGSFATVITGAPSTSLAESSSSAFPRLGALLGTLPVVRFRDWAVLVIWSSLSVWSPVSFPEFLSVIVVLSVGWDGSVSETDSWWGSG